MLPPAPRLLQSAPPLREIDVLTRTRVLVGVEWVHIQWMRGRVPSENAVTSVLQDGHVRCGPTAGDVNAALLRPVDAVFS